MVAKRVSVIVTELSAHIRDHGGDASNWHFEILDAVDALGRLGTSKSQDATRMVCEAYSARDAHDVECALQSLGCVLIAPNEGATRTFIWLERVVCEDETNPPPPKRALPIDR